MRRSSASRAGRACVALIFVLVAALGFALMSLSVMAHPNTIRVGEGILDDWDAVATRVGDPADVNGQGLVDIRMFWVAHDAEFFYVRFDGRLRPNTNTAISVYFSDIDGEVLTTAWLIKKGEELTLRIGTGREPGHAVPEGLAEYFPAPKGDEYGATLHAAWPLDQLGLAEDSIAFIWAEARASHSVTSAVKDRVPDAPTRLAYDLQTGTWIPHHGMAYFVTIGETGEPTQVVRRGEQLTLTIVVTNTGEAPMYPHIVSSVPPGTSYVPDSTRFAVGSAQSQFVEDVEASQTPLAQGITLPEIGPGQQGRVTFGVMVDPRNVAGNEIIATAFVDDGTNFVEVTATVVVHLPDIRVETATDAAAIAPGEWITFTIRIDNTGAVRARNVSVVSPVPEGMGYRPRSVVAPSGTVVQFQNAKTGTWHDAEPDDVAAISWVLEVIEAESHQFVSIELLKH